MLLRELGPMIEGRSPLEYAEVADPEPAANELLIRVTACAVCHTELDEIEGRTPPPNLPVIPGHQVVGTLMSGSLAGKRVGVAWINSACGTCVHCRAGNENLCADFRATGRDADGGYAAYVKVRADFVHPIPDGLSDAEAAPLLCAGAVGYRALRLANLADGATLGLYGFGASNHLVLKTARHTYAGSKIMVFSRNPAERSLAMDLGAAWAGAIEDDPPAKLDAAIDATPVWLPMLQALKHLAPGGRLVVNAIRKEEVDRLELLKLDFVKHLWMEKEIKSVANVARRDVREFLELAARAGIRPEYEEYTLADANRALLDIKQGRIRGAKVLRVV
ncbi:MAG TPA: zinc-binding alcohol dehydrogenase family protein [Anaerolineales bacterium]